MTKAGYTIPALIIVFGGGLAYWVMSNRDTTPVGLSITSTSGDGGELGEDEDGNTYNYQFHTGTWRENDSSLPIATENEDKPILVIYQNGTPVSGQIVEASDWSNVDENALGLLKNQKETMEEYGINTDQITEMIASLEESQQATADAESIFGPMTTLQSNFVW